MAPESERTCTKCGHPRSAHDLEQPYECFHLPEGAFEYSCDCDGFSYAPEPTLTCSEVVERLRQYEDLFDTIAEAWKNLPFAGVGNTLTCSADRSDIAAIDSAVEEQQKLRSTEGRGRRVQELEDQIAKHSLTPEISSTQLDTKPEKE